MWLDTFAHADGYATPEHGTLYETTTPKSRSITLLGTACLAYLGAVPFVATTMRSFTDSAV